MDREQAASALSLLRRVVAQARDDTALQNYGLIWMGSAVTNCAGFLATHHLFRTGHATPWPYALLWAAVLGANILTIALFKKGAAGAPSFIERQIWSIWTTFIVAMILTAVVNYLFGLGAVLFMPAVACILAAVAFSTMGAMMGRWWYLPAGAWAAMALVMAAVPHLQFALFGVLWGVTQFTGGALLHRARLRAARAGQAAPVPQVV